LVYDKDFQGQNSELGGTVDKVLIGLVVATAAEVAGLAYWLHLLQGGALGTSFLALIAGEAVEWSLLATLIVRNAALHEPQGGHVRGLLIKTALIIFSESLLWVCWVVLIDHLGFAASTLFLLITMHLKHGAAVSAYTGRPMSADIFDVSSISASVLEVGGAAIFYQLYFSGQVAVGIAVLAVCITIEHSLQFRSAGIFNPKGAPPAFS
jgi:hypothetical protein